MPQESLSKRSKRSNRAAGAASPATDPATVHSSPTCTRSDVVLAGQTHVLELLAKGEPLEIILAELVRTIEQCSPDMICSVLIYDAANRCLRHGAAPNLPDEYNTAVDGIPIGPTAGSCGTAAFRRDRVIVRDIASDPLWASFRAIALLHNLRACWSQPIFGSSGNVLGTFASYYRISREPTVDEGSVIERAAFLAGLAIERARDDKALRESEERFRQLTESVRLIPWEADSRSWKFTYVGPQSAEILGYPRDSWYENGFWLDHVHSEDRDRVKNYYLEHSKTDDHYDLEYRMISADGHTVWLHDVVHVIRGSGRDCLRGFMVDVSDRKYVEESLRQADRLASLGTFTAGIAHEVNNPIAAILLSAQRALSTVDGNDGHRRLTESLQLILENAERCGRIVKDVLKFSRQGSTSRQLTNLNDVVQTAVELVHTYGSERNSTIDIRLSSEITPIPLNTVEMEQVLVNLIRNAFESDAAGVRVTLRTQETEGSVQVSVQDNGLGMTAKQRRHMFDPFYSNRQDDGGTGLGLSLVHGIVSMHGGTIDVKSRRGRGTTITVRLPT